MALPQVAPSFVPLLSPLCLAGPPYLPVVPPPPFLPPPASSTFPPVIVPSLAMTDPERVTAFTLKDKRMEGKPGPEGGQR